LGDISSTRVDFAIFSALPYIIHMANVKKGTPTFRQVPVRLTSIDLRLRQ
jgi:hypothetical protein